MIQHAIGRLPKSHFWNEMFQKTFTRSLELSEGAFESKVKECGTQLDHFRKYGPQDGRPFSAFELGTGWYPIIPIGLYLCGASEIWTCDIAPLVRLERVLLTLQYFSKFNQDGRLEKLLPGVVPGRMAALNTILKSESGQDAAALLRKFNITILVRDAQQTGLPAGTIDFITSIGVLEYIPASVLANILAEFRRIGSEDLVMSHQINLIDQYCHFDSSITPFNRLKYPAKTWKYFNNPIIWQNRLVMPEYRSLLAVAGFKILAENNQRGSDQDFGKIELAPEFRKFSREDLMILISWLISKPEQPKKQVD